MRPAGFRRFEVTPRLPKDWPSMALKRVHAFGEVFDLASTRDGGKLKVTITRDGAKPKTVTIADGETTTIAF
jgi:hypothetical protein